MKSKTLPDVYDLEAQHVSDWLRIGQRPPTAAAKVLVLAVKLDRQHTPWPTRAAVASHLDIAIQTVDIVLSTQQALGRLRVRVETAKGAVKQRLTVVQRKHIVPSPELIAVVEAGERLQKRGTPVTPNRGQRKITL